MQIFHVTRAKEGPFAAFFHALHEQIRDPVCRIHIMGTSPFIPGVLPQLQKILNIQMPRLEIRTHCSLALTPLIYGNRRIIGHLKEGNHALTLAISSLDVRASGTDIRPVIT